MAHKIIVCKLFDPLTGLYYARGGGWRKLGSVWNGIGSMRAVLNYMKTYRVRLLQPHWIVVVQRENDQFEVPVERFMEKEKTGSGA